MDTSWESREINVIAGTIDDLICSDSGANLIELVEAQIDFGNKSKKMDHSEPDGERVAVVQEHKRACVLFCLEGRESCISIVINVYVSGMVCECSDWV